MHGIDDALTAVQEHALHRRSRHSDSSVSLEVRPQLVVGCPRLAHGLADSRCTQAPEFPTDEPACEAQGCSDIARPTRPGVFEESGQLALHRVADQGHRIHDRGRRTRGIRAMGRGITQQPAAARDGNRQQLPDAFDHLTFAQTIDVSIVHPASTWGRRAWRNSDGITPTLGEAGRSGFCGLRGRHFACGFSWSFSGCSVHRPRLSGRSIAIGVDALNADSAPCRADNTQTCRICRSPEAALPLPSNSARLLTVRFHPDCACGIADPVQPGWTKTAFLRQSRHVPSMPCHHPTNCPEPSSNSEPPPHPQIRLRPHHSQRPPTYPRHPLRDRKNPTKTAPFMKPSTCPSRKKVAKNLIPPPFTAHCHPAYQVRMIPEDTPPLTKLGASSATCPPFTRRSPAICPPLGMHAPRTADRARSAFNTIAPRTATFISGEACMVTPCGNPTPTSAARSAPSLLHWAGAATGGDRVEPRDPVPSLYVLPSAD